MMRPSLAMLTAAAIACSPRETSPGTAMTGPTDVTTDETPPPPPPPTTPATVTIPGEVVCTDPSARDGGTWFTRLDWPGTLPGDLWIWGSGVWTFDMDGDGDDDVVGATETGLLAWTNEGGTLVLDEARFAAFELSYAIGGSSADYDGDGDIDLLVGRFERPMMLLANDGVGQFTDVTATAIPNADRVYDPATGATLNPSGSTRTTTSSWGDMDGDGDLDLYVGNYGFVDESGTVETADFLPADPNFLLVNRGDGTFEDQSDRLPVAMHDGYDYAGGFFDLDDDADLDLMSVNDFGVAYPNVVLSNDGGAFTRNTDALGLDGLIVTGMGLAITDFNGDGLPDFAMSEWNKFKLLASQGALWVDTADSVGLSPNGGVGQKVAWGLQFTDVDNDGDDDLPVAFGFIANDNPLWTNPLVEHDALYIATTGHLDDVAATHDFDDGGVVRGFGLADFNADGFVDVFKRDLLGPSYAYLSNCDTSAWLDVDLRQPGTPNVYAIGARIQVVADTEVQTHWVTAGGLNFASNSPTRQHFGLGDAAVVDIVVRWPDGAQSTVPDVPTRRVVRIDRP